MALQALLFAREDSCRAWLQERLGEGVVLLPADARTGDDSVAEIVETPGVALVFVQFDHKNAALNTAIVEAISNAYPSLPVVAVGRDDAGDVVLAAMRAGAQDFFVIDRDDERFSSLLDRVLDRKRRARQAPKDEREPGRIVTVFSGPQSPLLAFLGGHIAFVLEAATQRDKRVLFFDLSTPGGNATIIFDGAQDYTALDILRDVERCDETLVESAFQQLQSGVYLLALPEDFTDEQLGGRPLDLARLIEIFRGLFDYVVICIDQGLGIRALCQAIENSDHSLLLSDQSVLRSRQNKAMLQEVHQQASALPPLKLVVVNYRSDIGMEPERLAELLGVPLAATLGGRPEVRIRAMNAGESMLEYAPSDGFTRGVTLLTEQILGIEAPLPRKKFTLGRLFGRGESA
ncbi:pilus assembly protein CpaE [Salinisphaera dokdonensis CL-ES53]|uniref:Pilus assembly protein CpaE n=1 Tax=Salinisphaera dokdonensis CL-ES53 TaxID=1304272 RepID=A0ABV2AY13_9GAMM